jgi:hypothetical protein
VSLRELQQAFAATCLEPEPPASMLGRLHGTHERWLVYRHMVRTRLEQMAKQGLRRTRATLGPERFSQAFSAYLVEDPPRTRYIRDVVSLFVAHAAPRWRDDPSLPPHTHDLARFEAARWELADLPEPAPQAAAEFDFDAVPVMGGAYRLLSLDYPVHRKRPAGEAYAAEPTALVMYRRPLGTKAEVLSINPITLALMQRWAGGRETVSEAIRAVALAGGFAVDARFLEGLCSVLADFLERGIVLGSRNAEEERRP